MNHDLSRSFGVLIAYILPGFIALWALRFVSPSIELWLTGGAGATPVFGGVVYATAAAITLGMVLNAVRWLLIDPIHHATGLSRPKLDDARLEANLAAFTRLVEDHFRYHQFYANTAIATGLGYPIWRWANPADSSSASDLGVVLLILMLLLASRDALSRYYTRTSRLLG